MVEKKGQLGRERFSNVPFHAGKAAVIGRDGEGKAVSGYSVKLPDNWKRKGVRMG